MDGTYVERLVARLAAGSDRPVLRHGGRDIAANALLGSVFRYARALSSIGIARGRLVALFAPNSPDAIAIRTAANLLGAATVYLSVPPTPEGRAALLAQIAPDLLVVFPETAHLLPDDAAPRVAAPRVAAPRVAAVGIDLAQAEVRLDRIAAAQPDTPLESLARPDDLAVIVSSGGTTGVPKGSWRHFAPYTAMVSGPEAPDRRQLVNGRLAYLSQVLVDATLLGGGCVVLEDGFEPARCLATIEAERITNLFLVEPQLFELMDHPDVARRDLSSLHEISHIGASAPPVLRRRARARLGPVLAHVYGASEMGLVSALSPAGHDLARPASFGTAGRVRPGVEIRFRRDDGTLAAPGEAGTIEVRSAAMAGGYRNRPEQQAMAFAGGWYHTGDLGFVDADGDLHVLGRADDARRIGGALVTPTLIEETLCGLAEIRYAAVMPDPEAGWTVAALVAWPGASIDEARCRAACAALVADRLVVVPVARVPLTEQGKPDRAAIRALGRARG